MSDLKRIILTNETPNDQGGIIRNNTIDWTRFLSNPVMLYHHGDDPILFDTPIGHWEDLQFDGTNWTAIPVFSNVDNKKIREIAALYAEGNLKAASIGGAAYWKKTGRIITNDKGERVVEYALTESGLKESDRFITYEASIVPLPSNADALTLSAKCYNEAEILTLNSRFMKEDEKVDLESKPATDEIVEEKVEQTGKKKATKEPEAVEEKRPEHIILSSDEDFKSELRTSIFGWVKSLFASDPVKHMEKEPDGDEPVGKTELPKEDLPVDAQEKSKLEAEAKIKVEEEAKAKEKKEMEAKVKDENLEAATLESEELAKVEACKNEAEVDELCQKMKSNLPKVISDAIEKKKASFPEKVKNNSNLINMPEQKSPEELAKEKMAAAPKADIKLGSANVPEFTQLKSEKEGRQIIDKVLQTGGVSKDIDSHRVVLESILKDPRLKAVVEKITFSDKSGNRSIPMATAADLSARFQSGNIDFMNFRTGKLEGMTQLASSDLLASPDLIAVEWLSMFVFAQFPSGTWKAEIPVYGATTAAGKNLGFIWANIAANPAVYQGSRPVTPTDYEYDDTAVAVTLSPFYLQPMLWQPLKMQQLRYDQMASGWAQAMNVFNTYIDNYLIKTIASLVPAASVVLTRGGSFTIDAATNPDAFLLNTAFAGSLAKPRLDELLVLDQIFKKQNYPEGTKFVVVNDPTMDRYFTADEKTGSLLTRFVNSEGSELISYKNAMLRNRSKVALWNKATSAVVDPASVIAPTTTVSACLAFVPDQVALALANLDVFMIQDPSKYGYKMSADIRQGAALLRANANGAALLTYGDPQN